MEITRLSTAIAILTSMITPAVLISACGTLILSTSNRLGRVVDRVRKISEQMEELAKPESDLALLEERRAVLFGQLETLVERARNLQRALRTLYVSVSAFVLTSISIAAVTFTDERYSWVSVLTGLLGTTLLMHVSVLLINEARLARTSLRLELEFILELGKLHAPEAAVKEPRRNWPPFGRP